MLKYVPPEKHAGSKGQATRCFACPLVKRYVKKMNMEDEIKEIGIDEEQRLYVKPLSAKFPMMYREAIEVNWNQNTLALYGGIPRQWSHLDWYKQIIK
ncbi:MAG: hypothetical protein ACJA04_000370 [Cellvibrionaceae bacterium]